MTLIAVYIGYIIGICFGLHFLILPILTNGFRTRYFTPRWLWAIGVFVFPFLFTSVYQSSHLKIPSWKSWVVRLTIASLIAFILMQVGNRTNSSSAFELKGVLANLFTSEIVSIEGRTVEIFGGNKIENPSSSYAFASSFAVAAVGIFAGAIQFYAPTFKAIFLALISFIGSCITNVISYAWLISSISSDSSGEIVSMIHDTRLFYNFHLWYLVVFVGAILWARYDIQFELNQQLSRKTSHSLEN